MSKLMRVFSIRYNPSWVLHRFPGRFGLENPCFCSCLGRNSSSIIDAVISDGLDASNCEPPFPCISKCLYRALFLSQDRSSTSNAGKGGHLLCKFEAQILLCGPNHSKLGRGVEHSFSDFRSWRTGVDEDQRRRSGSFQIMRISEKGKPGLRVGYTRRQPVGTRRARSRKLEYFALDVDLLLPHEQPYAFAPRHSSTSYQLHQVVPAAFSQQF